MTKSVKQPAELKRKVFTLKQKKLPNFSKGIKAETIAQNFLEKQGYLILEKNLSLKNLEIDLIAFDKKFNELVFVEVKYRQSKNFGDGPVAVNQQKIAKITAVAENYLKKKQFKKYYRFDIISVSGNLNKPEIEHFENITWL